MNYFCPLIMKNTLFFSKSVIFYHIFDSLQLILPISRTSCQDKSATPAKSCRWNIATCQTLSGKKCYSSQNLSGKMCYSPKLVLLSLKLVRQNMLLDLKSIKSIKSNLSNDWVAFFSWHVWASSIFFLISFGWSNTFFLTRFGE